MMGVTAGELNDAESVEITITLNGPIPDARLATIREEIAKLVAAFNQQHPGKLEIIT